MISRCRNSTKDTETHLEFKLAHMSDHETQQILSIYFIGDLSDDFCGRFNIVLASDRSLGRRYQAGNFFVDLKEGRSCVNIDSCFRICGARGTSRSFPK